MKKMIFPFHLAVCIIFYSCQSPRETPVSPAPNDEINGLIQRIMKDKASMFKVEYIEPDQGKDVFELEGEGTTIILRGNNGVSVASALNYYLKYYLNCHISWNGSNLDFPDVFPSIEKKIHRSSPYRYRYYLNYCTFNYSMAWWDWDRWQKEIDWMALNGINMPLALTGEAAIWQEVYKKIGFSDEELDAFFSGPSYFSWLWMGNIDAWGGPLPQHWMDSHKDLQKKILAKERGLGMTPVLPAFTGHVPPSFGERFPNAKLKQTNWEAGFDDVYILDPSDPLFDQIGAMFLETQTKSYGTDHFYSADTFNENVPPTNDSTFLSQISRKVFETMAHTDPEAVWVMQGWMFHYNDEYWHPTQIQALLGSIPDDHMIILDLYSESHPVWNRTEAYYGKPWIWNMLHNFGGNTGMFGRMEAVANDPAGALHDPASGKMYGIGLTPEGIEQNPALYELMLENVWRDDAIDVDSWMVQYVTRRYGKENSKINQAWNILRNTVYDGGLGEGTPESILQARPTWDHEGYRIRTQLDYNPAELLVAWKLFIEQSRDLQNSEGFQYDLVDLTRQVLVNYANPLQQEIAKAFRAHDLVSFQEKTGKFLVLLDDIDRCLNTHQDFLLGRWIAGARSWGITEEEKDLYEFNARCLITLWGDKDSPLHEYSNRQWAGLIQSFYKPRWEQFFKFAENSLKNQSSMNLEHFDEMLKNWEWDWANATDGHFPVQPSGDPVAVTHELFGKYYADILSIYENQ